MADQASLGDISDSEDEEENLKEDTESYESRQIKNLVEIQNGYAFKKKDYAENSNVFLFRATNFTEDGAIDLSEEAYLPEDYYDEFEDYQLEKNDIIINMVGANTGKMCLIDSKVLPALLNQNMWKLKPKDGINQHFFYYRLKKGVSEILRTKQGSTRGFLTKYTFKNLSLDSIPSDIDEQRRIASVLYNVDQAIQKTEEIIEQTQRVKKGLMQDLFTEGYYSHEEYKQENMGPQELEIPESWEIEKYRDVCRDTSVGVVVKPSKYYDDSGDIPLLRSANIKAGKIIDKDMMYTTEEKNKEIEKSQVSAGDILTVRSGYPGTSAVVEEDFEGANCVDLLISKTNEKMVPQFAAEYLNSYLGKKQVARFQNGLAQKHLNLGSLEKIDIVVPPIEEQRKIVEVLESADEEILNQEEQKEQLQRLKKGLMQDLLTGEVRTGEDVRVLNEVVEVEG